jgi:hypothetical protein
VAAKQILFASAFAWAIVGAVTGLFALNGTSLGEFGRVCVIAAALYLVVGTTTLHVPSPKPTTRLDREVLREPYWRVILPDPSAPGGLTVLGTALFVVPQLVAAALLALI